MDLINNPPQFYLKGIVFEWQEQNPQSRLGRDSSFAKELQIEN